MITVKPTVEEIVFHIPEGCTIKEYLEKVGRTCYKSEDRITPESAPKFLKMLKKRGHESIFEFCDISARVTVDRGTSHELVRHRHCSFAQESTRYINYNKKYGGITIIEQPFKHDDSHILLDTLASEAEQTYNALIEAGEKPELARSVLPIATKTELVIKANLRQWQQLFNMRCSSAAAPTIRSICTEIFKALNQRLPEIFPDGTTY